MFPFTTSEQDILQSPTFRVDLRVEVGNADGTLKNLGDLGGTNWVNGVTWGWDIDRPVPEARVQLRRDITGTNSLAPLAENSTLNVDDSAVTAALVDAGRALKIYTGAYASTGTAPTSSEMQLVFDGEIDEVSWGQPVEEIVARSALMSALNDRWVESEIFYGTSSGDAIESVIQQIVDDWSGLTTTVWVPSSPGFLVTTYKQQKEPVLQALQTLSQLIGWDLRERWSSSAGGFALKFYEPDRTASTTMVTIGSSQYYDVSNLTISRGDVRNVVNVIYSESSDGQRHNVTVQSTSSIDRFGRRWMEMEEAADSSISSSSEANTFASAALADLKDPSADQAIEMAYFWPAELQDYYTFTANNTHYSVDQDWAVYGIRHTLASDKARTNLQVRGKPAGQYISWHANNPAHRQRNQVEVSQDNRFLNWRRIVDNSAQTVTFYWDWGRGQQQAWIHTALVTEPEVTDTFAGFASVPPDTTLVRGVDSAQYQVAFPDPGKVRILQFEPRDSNYARGPVIRIVVDPQPIQQASDLPNGSIVASQLIKSAQKFGSDIAFSPTDYNTVTWSSGTITMSDGTEYTVNSGNTGDMADLTYMYFDPDVSSVAIQTSTNSTDMRGDNRLLMCVGSVASATDQSAFYVPSVGVLGLNEDQISANITATNILKANTITAALINVAQLSALSADLGTVTAGTVSAGVIVASSQFTATVADFSGSITVGSSTAGGALTLWDLVRFRGSAAFQIEDGRIAEWYTAAGTFGGDIRASTTLTGNLELLIKGGDLRFQDSTSDVIGFFGTTGTAQESVAANATAIWQALINLGLISS